MAGAGPDTKKALQQYYNCPCQPKGEGFGYVCDKKERYKLGELMQNQVEKLTGVKPKGCSWWYLQNDPWVREVLYIFNNAQDYPQMFNESLPASVYQGVLYYRGVLQRARNWWLDYDQKKAEEKERMDKMKSSRKAPRRLA